MFTPKEYSSRYFCPSFWAKAGQYDDAHFVQIATMSSPRGLPAVSFPVNYVEVQAETQNVRYRDDGIVPTNSIGMLLIAGAAPTRFPYNKALKFIEATSGAKLNIRFV